MMLQPTPQQLELREEFKSCNDSKRKKEIREQLDALVKEQFEKAYKESPFKY